MRTVLQGYDLVAESRQECTGADTYGHVPGHQFHDVTVTLSRRGENWRAVAREQSGSAQGYDEVHRSTSVVARGETYDQCLSRLGAVARAGGIEQAALIRATASVTDEAFESLSR